MRARRTRVWAFLLLFFMFFTGHQVGFSKNKKLPDLTVSSLSCDASAVAGGHLKNVAAGILNQGKRPSGSFRVKLYLSPDPSITADDIDTGTSCEVVSLARKEASTCNEDVKLPASLAPGLYYLGAIVDDLNEVAEKDESNNSRAFGPIRIDAGTGGGAPPTSQGTIQVDGDPSDWQGILPIITDAAGDGPFDSSGRYYPGGDLLRISITNDNVNVYFLMEFAGTPYTGGITLFLDTDVNPATGCNGFESVVHTSASEAGAHLVLADYRDCSVLDNSPGVVVSAVKAPENHSLVEASIRIDDLFRFTPGRKDFRLHFRSSVGETPDDVWPPTVYSLTSHYQGGANLRITFNSETVSPDFTNPCGTSIPGWHYGITLTETAEVGVTITSYKTVLYDANGGYLYTVGTKSGEEFARLFGDCGPESNHIGPNGKACSQSLCLDIGGSNGGQIDMTFSGTDDRGNQVRFTSGRLVLLGR